MNALLASLPFDDQQRLAATLTTRPLKARETLQKNGDRIKEIYFLGRSVCSITQNMEDGGLVEVATVGQEGLVGIGAILGNSIATGDAFIQVESEPAQAMPIDVFHDEIERGGAFSEVISRYAQAFLAMIMQSVACNALHSAEERCCRWLLMTHDRIGVDEFPLTHEFLAMMLGVRRPTVTLVMADLNRAGILSHARGRMRIIDRRGLENAACECHRQLKTIFQRLHTPLTTVSTGMPLATFQSRGGDLPAPAIERISDVSRKPE
jgi:CRP-like cAMP-binding protein